MGNLLCFALVCFWFGLVCLFVCLFVLLLCKITPNLCVKGNKIFFVKFTFCAENYRMLIKIYSKLSQWIKRNKRDLTIDDSRGSKISKCFLAWEHVRPNLTNLKYAPQSQCQRREWIKPVTNLQST